MIWPLDNYVDGAPDTPNTTVSELYLVLCTLQVHNTSVLVDAQNKMPDPVWPYEAKKAPDIFQDSRGRDFGVNMDVDAINWVSISQASNKFRTPHKMGSGHTHSTWVRELVSPPSCTVSEKATL